MTKFLVKLIVSIGETKSVYSYIEFPFVPFPSLQLLDYAFDRLNVLDVAWDHQESRFICRADPLLVTTTSLQDALNAGWEEVEQRKKKLCPECNGTGKAPNPFFSCQFCKDDDGESTGRYEDYRRKRDSLED